MSRSSSLSCPVPWNQGDPTLSECRSTGRFLRELVQTSRLRKVMWLVEDPQSFQPAEHLAMDEALLDACESGELGETLRFWTPTSPFVVLGYGNSWRTEAHVEACEAESVPILRRCSGGGTILQLPGVLNFNLVLHITETGPLSTITGTNRYVMDRMKAAFERLPGLAGRISVRGTTDLCLDTRKFGGNAQRRRRKALVFHGSLLLHADLARIQRLLTFPSRQPDYRESRGHLDFLTCLEVSSEKVCAGIGSEWGADVTLSGEKLPWKTWNELMQGRYQKMEWHHKF